VKEPRWVPTNVSNLLKNRQSGNYYGRAKVSGKQKWRALETTVLAVAKLRLRDFGDEVKGAANGTAGSRQSHAPSKVMSLTSQN